MTKLRRTWMFVLAVSAVCGCASRRGVDLLESRLREQESILADSQEQLQSTENDLTVARRETAALRDQLAGRGEKTILPEEADRVFRAEGIKFNKLVTGTLDRDDRPGDELLATVLVPHDAAGETVKLPGEIQLQAFDLSADGDQTLIGTWKFNADESHKQWHSGFLASGYMFQLPWKQKPQASRIVLHARLTAPDGRRFDTSEIINLFKHPILPVVNSKVLDVPDPDPENSPPPTIVPRATNAKRIEDAPRLLPSEGDETTDIGNPKILKTSDNWTDATIPRLR